MKDWKYINGAEVGNSDGVARMFEGLVKDEDKEVEKDSGAIDDLEKVGNARYTTREDVISHLDTDLYDICKKVPAGSPSFAYVSELQKKGWDISTISKYSKEIGKIIDQYKVGNSSSDEEYWKKQYIEASRKKGVPENKIQEFIKKIEKEGAKGVLSPIKNSKSDDKFSYVMREFDEGKLKTPDGKVVTNPEQAKAIAYSESKKAENGIERAFKAMKV